MPAASLEVVEDLRDEVERLSEVIEDQQDAIRALKSRVEALEESKIVVESGRLGA